MLTVKNKGDAEYITQLRREIHRFPELSGQEQRTAYRVFEELTKLGIKYIRTNIAGHGVIAVIGEKVDGPVVGLRADMDALPIKEDTGIDFSSEHEGIMHACGHDSHTAMLLGAAKILTEIQDQLPGRVVLIFQPAEEMSPIGGAKPLIEAGAFEQTKPDAIFGMHVWPALEVGKVGICPGYFMGASDRFKIKIYGKGGHASMPQETIDAGIVAVQISQMLQTIVSRNVNPLDAAVITVGHIQAGTRYNVIPHESVLEGTVRSFRPQVRELLRERLIQIAEDVAHAMGATMQIEYNYGYPVLDNDPTAVQTVQASAVNLWGEGALANVEPALVAEDFAVYLQQFKGAYLWLGCGFEDSRKNYPLHHPKFLVDERVLPLGAELLAQIAVQFLNEKRGL